MSRFLRRAAALATAVPLLLAGSIVPAQAKSDFSVKPFMGWSSWSVQSSNNPAYGTKWLTEANVKSAADSMAKNLRKAGYNQINLDAGILSRKGGGPASLAGLAGQKVAVQTGSYIHRYLLGALGDAQIKPAEIIHIYSADVEAALERGDVDAAAVPIANVEALKSKGYPLIDLASKDHPKYLGTSSTVVTEKFLKAEPDIVTAWQAAQRDAVGKAKADWPGFLAYTVSINGFPPKIVEATTVADQWRAEPFTPEGLELLKGTKQFLVDQKFIRTDFNLDDWIVAQPA